MTDEMNAMTTDHSANSMVGRKSGLTVDGSTVSAVEPLVDYWDHKTTKQLADKLGMVRAGRTVESVVDMVRAEHSVESIVGTKAGLTIV